MTNRERLLAVLDRKPVDRIPWIPRLSLWYNAARLSGTLPERFRTLSLREVERSLNLGTPARDGKIHFVRRENVRIETRREGDREITEYQTPVGAVRSVTRHTKELDAMGLPGRVEEYPLKSPGDYRIWEYIVEHTEWVRSYEEYHAYDREIGDDGLPMVSAGDVPFHEFLLNLAGYEHAYYHLSDYPDEVERLLSVMTAVQRERLWPVLLDSPARLLLHGVHLSSLFTPPPMFSRYILPYYRELMPLLHDRGKAVAMHADNDTSAILGLLLEAGWDMLECFVTAPMVPLTMEEARRRCGNRMILWGGIPSSLLSPDVPEEQFRSYVRSLFRTVAPGDAFILGVADNVMPDSLIERVEWVSDYVRTHGGYPLR